MKKLIIMGGLIGLLIGIIFGLTQGAGWLSLLCRAGIVSLAAGLLLRRGGGVWSRGMQGSSTRCLTAEAALSSVEAPTK